MSPNEKLYLALVLFAFSAFSVTVFALSFFDGLRRRREALTAQATHTTSMPRGAAAH